MIKKNIIQYIKDNFEQYYTDKGPENGILQGTKYSGASTHARACLATLVKIIKPKNILEIGSWHYESSNAMAFAMDEIYGAGGGMIDSYDIRVGGSDGLSHFKPLSPRINPRYWYAFHSDYDEWKYTTELVFDFKKHTNDKIFNLNKNILQENVQYLNPTSYDLIFIDGDHSYEGLKKDFELCQCVVNANTLFVLDNVWDSRLQNVRKFYDELDYEKWDFEDWNDKFYTKNLVQDTGIFVLS